MPQYVFATPLRMKNGAKADPQRLGEVVAKATAVAVASGPDADPVAEYIRDEAEKIGRRHPFYPLIEWDVATAARAHQVDQVRSIIRVIRIVDDNTAEPQRAFIHVRLADGGGNYRDRATIANNLDLQIAALKQAEKELAAFRARYREFAELCDGAMELEAKSREIRARLEGRENPAA